MRCWDDTTFKAPIDSSTCRLLWGVLGLGDLLTAHHLVSCMGAGDFAEALTRRLLSHPAAAAAHLQAALDASVQVLPACRYPIDDP